MIQVREQYGNIYVRILDLGKTFNLTLERVKQIPQCVYKTDTGEWMFPKERLSSLLKIFDNQIVWVQPLRQIVKNLKIDNELIQKHLELENQGPFKTWRCKPYPYQAVAAHFMAQRCQAADFDGVGLGKTPSTLAACYLLWQQNKVKRVLVVTLSSIKTQWAKEVNKFLGFMGFAAVGTKSNRMKVISAYKRSSLRSKHMDVLVINYEMLRQQAFLEKILNLKFDAIILDEAQKIKTGVTDQVLEMTPSQNALGCFRLKNIPYRFLATATPIQGKAEEVWSLFYFLNDQVLGSWPYFREQYCQYSSRFGITGYKNEGELYYRIAPYFIRRTKDMPEIQQQLPKVKHNSKFFEMTSTQSKIESYLKDLIEDLKDHARHIPLNGRVINGKLLGPDQLKEYYDQMIQGYHQFMLANCDSPQLLRMSKTNLSTHILNECGIKPKERLQSPKIDYIIDLINQLEFDEPKAKVVMFTRFARMAELVSSYLPGSLLFHGKLPAIQKDYIKESFMTNPASKILVTSDALSAGANLQAAKYLIHIDLPWSPQDIEQRNGRIDRTGNPNPNIEIQYFIMANSYDQHMLEILAKKSELAKTIIEGK
jgi:SNF2 family DNA or RNA helicase